MLAEQTREGEAWGSSSGLGHTIVASHKRIAIAASHLAIDKLPRALEGDVHVSVDGLKFTCIRVSEKVASVRIKHNVNNIKHYVPL